MSGLKVKFIGPCLDLSGYGEACRHDFGALLAAGVDVTTEIPRYSLEVADYGELGIKAKERENAFKDYDIVIMHVTPNVYGQYIEEGKYHIGRVFWETDKLPRDFARNIPLLQEVWTGSKHGKQAVLNAVDFEGKIKLIPEAVDASIQNVDPYITADEAKYKFYSIFEWTERKDPTSLLTAFWQEFNKEPVSLTLKVFVDNHTIEKKQEIEQAIKRIKKTVTPTAPVYLVSKLMDRHQIYRFHKTFDCFVSAHRGEGWGIPQMEAALMGNPVISTNLGGIHEYFTNEKDAFLVDYQLTPLKANTRNQQWYTCDQNWGQANIETLRKYMRYCYRNRNKARAAGMAGKRTVEKLFSLEAVGEKMLGRLQKI